MKKTRKIDGGREMSRYETEKLIVDKETGKTYRVGDIVTYKNVNGGGCGGCVITKITDNGFRFCQGTGRDKNVKYENIVEIY